MNSVVVLFIAAAMATAAGPYTASNVRCYDGDTCTVDLDLGLDVTLRAQTLRLCDINAPELKGASRGAGLRARDYLVGLLTRTSTAPVEVVVPGGEHDSFGRWLAYMYVEGKSVNALMLQSGHATPYERTCAGR